MNTHTLKFYNGGFTMKYNFNYPSYNCDMDIECKMQEYENILLYEYHSFEYSWYTMPLYLSCCELAIINQTLDMPF